jgi:hypothetical protein
MNTDTPKRSPPQPSDLEQKFHEAVRIVYLLTISRMAFTTERLTCESIPGTARLSRYSLIFTIRPADSGAKLIPLLLRVDRQKNGVGCTFITEANGVNSSCEYVNPSLS